MPHEVHRSWVCAHRRPWVAAGGATTAWLLLLNGLAACGGFSSNSAPSDAGTADTAATQGDASPLGAAVVDATSSDVFASDLDGGAPGDGGAARCSVRRLLTQPGVTGLVPYATKLYVSDATSVRSCALPDCGATVALSTTERDVQSLTLGGNYAFWLGLPNDGGTTRSLRRASLADGSIESVELSDQAIAQIRVTRGPNPQLTLMGAHLYRASPGVPSLAGSPFVSFYYAYADVALTVVDNAIFYQNRTVGVGLGAGLFTCVEGTSCTHDRPLFQYAPAVQAIHADANRVFFATNSTVYRVPRLGLPDAGVGADGGVAPAPVFADAQTFVRYLDASDSDELVVGTTNNGVGKLQFIPKAGGSAVVCPTEFVAPQAFASDEREIFVADSAGVVAVHR